MLCTAGVILAFLVGFAVGAMLRVSSDADDAAGYDEGEEHHPLCRRPIGSSAWCEDCKHLWSGGSWE